VRRPGQSRLTIVHVELDQANDFVDEHHRHSDPVVGHKFSIGVVDESSILRGVAIVGRPVARMRQDGQTVEVLRVATDGFPNAPSALYGACLRATFALGYRRLGTYTLKSESGKSLEACGWKIVGEVKGREWDTPSRRRKKKGGKQTEDKWLWEPIAILETPAAPSLTSAVPPPTPGSARPAAL
jgi:hypothetical protein